MKKVATTQLFSSSEEIFFNEYDDGTCEKVTDETATKSSLEELQALINTKRFKVTEITACG